jgi:hypothetical protein
MRKDISKDGLKTRWKKGQSGNPAGRPPEMPEIDTLLAEVLSEEREGECAAKAILKALLRKAVRGDVRAAEVLLNRAWGKPKEHTDIQLTATPVNRTKILLGGQVIEL